MGDADPAAFLKQLRANVGATGTPLRARDAVNQAMIRHWCDAMEDANPSYTDPDRAAAGPHGGIVAPPTMLNAWTMIGNIPRPLDPNDPQGGVNALLDRSGYVGVVATNCEHVYKRYLRLGDLITGTQKLVDVSEEKQTALGIGHFVTTETEYHDQHGEHIGSMFFRILKFRPGTGRQAALPAATEPRPKRPRPSMNADSAWFWEGCRAHELRVQTFADGTVVYPPIVRNPKTGEMPQAPTWKVASGRGRLYSYNVVHHPQVPAFDYPLVIGLVELDEGVRLVANVVGCGRDQVEIGMPLEVTWIEADDDVTLPAFRPARPARRQTTLTIDDVEVGDPLPLCPVPITPTLIVAAAIASRDYQDVHHDRDMAHKKGSKDIFMNILASSGLSGRYISDWAGPDAIFRNLKLRLGAPNYPYDTMTMSGKVEKKEIVDGQAVVTVSYQGVNSLGAHVTGTADIVLPRGA
ncbi:MAG TPA: OB-fold domain-containing protein [Acidimicrobiales bacterium]|nr:OB-fold domain-containing protein [Acidimicrobiales bacterium]